jgi:hypothetical protein
MYPAGSIVNLDAAIEAQLVASADADRNVLPTLVAQSYAGWTRSSVNAAGDVSWITLASVIVPGGTMGPNSKLVIVPDWSYTNSASQKDLGVDWGGANFAGPTVSTSAASKFRFEIMNSNSLAIQKVLNSTSYGPVTGAHDVYTSNTLYDTKIDFKARWRTQVVSETIALVGYSIWHFPGN